MKSSAAAPWAPAVTESPPVVVTTRLTRPGVTVEGDTAVMLVVLVLTCAAAPARAQDPIDAIHLAVPEIPVARELFGELDLADRTVALDALHTQAQTARELVLEHGAHYLLTVKNNQPTLRQSIEKRVPSPPAGFSPSGVDADPGPHG